MKTAWEYRKIKLTASNHGTDEILHLTTAGEEGWEIVHISADDVAYLKRPIEKAHPAKRRRPFSHANEKSDEIVVDVLSCILLALEPSCHSAATRPCLAGRRVAIFRLHARNRLFRFSSLRLR
jgi:hypothetical protein